MLNEVIRLTQGDLTNVIKEDKEKEDCHTSLNFNGHYLVEIDKDLKPTGRAINGYGNPIVFSHDELIIEEIK